MGAEFLDDFRAVPVRTDAVRIAELAACAPGHGPPDVNIVLFPHMNHSGSRRRRRRRRFVERRHVRSVEQIACVM